MNVFEVAPRRRCRDAWYRVSGTERVAVGCAAQTRYPRTRTYFEVAPRSRCGESSKRSEQEALVEIDPMGTKKIGVLLDECPLPVRSIGTPGRQLSAPLTWCDLRIAPLSGGSASTRATPGYRLGTAT